MLKRWLQRRRQRDLALMQILNNQQLVFAALTYLLEDSDPRKESFAVEEINKQISVNVQKTTHRIDAFVRTASGE